MCGNYSREETIQGRKLYEEIRYVHVRLDCDEGSFTPYNFGVWFIRARLCITYKCTLIKEEWSELARLRLKFWKQVGSIKKFSDMYAVPKNSSFVGCAKIFFVIFVCPILWIVRPSFEILLANPLHSNLTLETIKACYDIIWFVILAENSTMVLLGNLYFSLTNLILEDYAI